MVIMMNIYLAVATVLIFYVHFSTAGLSRPRGVSPEKASFYQHDTEFKCLSTGFKIPKEYINDDYCDCQDGSDEPGTSACSGGVFYCLNKLYTGAYICSSRVDDGICDCCDGSDETKVSCEDTCEQLSQKAKAQQEVLREKQEKGYKLKLEYIQQGKRMKDEKLSRLTSLEQDKSLLEKEKESFEIAKNDAEAPEKEAIEKHKQAWEQVKAERQKAKDAEAASVVFIALDVNADGKIDFPEIMNHLEFDIDSDGKVSEEEAKEYLEELDEVDQDLFAERIWPNIKEIYKPETQGDNETTSEAEEPTTDTEHKEEVDIVEGGSDDDKTTDEADKYDDDTNTEKDEDDYDEDDDDLDYDVNKNENTQSETPEEEKMPEYDEATKRLIEVADEARKVYEDADVKVRDTEREISEIKKYLELDLGPDQEFAALKDQCFEYTDREYTYRLCPFDKTIQKPKSGGIETTLGNWGQWHGPGDDKYDAMKYENGQGCWNGPNRSTQVNLHCGAENALTGASEPSRCEYHFEFSTPARCSQPQATDFHNIHTEL